MEDSVSSEIAPEPGQYRIMSKRSLVWIIILVSVASAVAMFVVRSWVQTYLLQVARISVTNPAVALEQLVFLVQTVFGSMTVALMAMSAFVGWYGFRILRSGHVPPPGAWLLEGKKVATGAAAERAAKLHMFVCALLATAGIVTFALGHRLVEMVPPPAPHRLQHGTTKGMNVTSAPTYPRSPRDAGLDRS
jgi:hypothetical protein